MSTINIKCVDQVLNFTNMPVITSGDQNVDQVKFDFCPLWDGFIKVAVFFQQKSECSYSIINADGTCPIPNSILRLDGKIYIAVTGTSVNDEVRTSNILCYSVEEGIVDASLSDEFPNDIPEEEKEDIYNKILELCFDMNTLCQDLIRNFAYVRITDINEFEFGETQLEAKIRGYTYSREQIDDKLSSLDTTINDTIVKDINNLQSSLNVLSDNMSKIESDLIYKIETDVNNLSETITSNYNQLITLTESLSARVTALEAK